MKRNNGRGRATRPRAVVIVVAAAAAVATSVGQAAFAETYSAGGATVGTNGSDARGSLVGISQGGCTSGEIAMSIGDPNRYCSYYGDADGNALGVGLLGAESEGLVAASDTGGAEGGCLSLLGCVTGQGAAVSGTGTAHGTAAAAGTGTATANEQYPVAGPVQVPRVAVSATGNAQGSDVAVTGGGNANGGVVGVTAWGDSSGGVASVDPDRTVGTSVATAHSTLRLTGKYNHTGLNQSETAAQVAAIAQMPAPDTEAVAASVAERAALVQTLAPQVAVSLGSKALNGWDPFVVRFTGDALQMQMYNGCVPQSIYATYYDRGMPSQNSLWYEMKIYESNGATMRHAAAIVRKYWRGPSGTMPMLDKFQEPIELFVRAKGAIDRFDQGSIINVLPQMMWSWRGEASDNYANGNSGHAITIRGYSEDDGGWLEIADGVSDGVSRPGAGYGRYYYRLNDLYMAAKLDIIW